MECNGKYVRGNVCHMYGDGVLFCPEWPYFPDDQWTIYYLIIWLLLTCYHFVASKEKQIQTELELETFFRTQLLTGL